MGSDRSKYVIETDRLPGSEAASTFDGHAHCASVWFFLSRNAAGTGPDLHLRPYEETFILQGGRVRFTVGEEMVKAVAGEIAIVSTRTPHKFVSLCPGG
jgi:hypothetical protein